MRHIPFAIRSGTAAASAETADFTEKENSMTPSRTAYNITGLLRRSTPLRCALISCLAVVIGVLLGSPLLPFLTDHGAVSILAAHLPAEGTGSVLYWLSLVASRFPFWLLLALAGFTRFSGGLTSAILIYRGVCDGVVLAFLGSMTAMAAENATALPIGFPIHRLPAAFAVWAVTDLLIRLVMTLGARSVAGMRWEACGSDGRMTRAVSLSLLRYLTLCLGGLGAILVSCGIYTVFLYS